jgi:hypothetical protein
MSGRNYPKNWIDKFIFNPKPPSSTGGVFYFTYIYHYMKYIIKESQYISLLENLDKNKKFLTKHMGIDFTGKIEQITSAYKVPYNFYRNGGISLNHAMSYLNNFGPMYFFELGDYEYLYQDRGNKDWFIDERGVKYIKDEFSERLGLDVLGLRFSDIIDMYFNEEEPLNESVDKNKRLLIGVMGEDLTGKIKEIKDGSDIPKRFRKYLELGNVKQQIDMVGPMYLVKIRGNYYLYQDQSKFYQSHNDSSFGEQFMSEDGTRDRSGKILEELGLDVLGLRFSDIIDIFFKEDNI